MKALKAFKKWFLNLLDSIFKSLKNTDNVMKILFLVPALVEIATVATHTSTVSRCNSTGPTNIPYYVAGIMLFLSMLFSMVVTYVGIGYGGKRKISSFIVLMLFNLIYIISTIMYLVLAYTDLGTTASDVTPSLIICIICVVCVVIGSVFAAIKIDPEYSKERV